MSPLNSLKRFPRLDAASASAMIAMNVAAFAPNFRPVSDALFVEGMAFSVVGGILMTAGKDWTRTSQRFRFGGRVLLLGLLLLAAAVSIGASFVG
jgi:uncharacterized protein involved in response to NO